MKNPQSGQRAAWWPEILWLTAAIAVPLAFNPWGGSAFELPKAALLRALTLPLGVAMLATAGRRSLSTARRPVPLLWPALVCAGAWIAATVASVHSRVSLWGSYERQQGLITLLAYPALFLLTASQVRTRAQWERLWSALVWGSAPIVAYGLAQAAGLDPLGWRTDAASPVLSTIGRANFLGSYLVLILPLTAARVVTASRRWPYRLLAVAQLLCLVATQARGAWLGAAAAAAAFGLTWAVTTRRRRWVWLTITAALIAVGGLTLLVWPGGPLAPLAHFPGLDRLAALSDFSSGSTAARLTIWRAVLPLIGARPWLGYGPETLRPLFAGVFPPQLVYYQGRDVLVDRAHNGALDLLLSAGGIGLVAFAALVAGLGWSVWRGLRAAIDRRDQVAWSALVAAVAGHLVDLQFGFELTASATVFWLLLALAAALSREPEAAESAGTLSLPIPPSPHLPSPSRATGFDGERGLAGAAPAPALIWLPPLLAALALIGYVSGRPLLADVAAWRAQQDALPPAERLAAAYRAVRLWPLEPEYRYGLAAVLTQQGDFPAAEAQLSAAERLSPADPRVWATRGALYAAWAIQEPARYAQAEAAARQAVALAPTVATYHTALGWVLARQGRPAESIAELERAVALDATDGTAYGYLADLYTLLGREAEAAHARKEALRWHEP